jgi:DNA-binding GntR family transcriptional regulator
LRAGVARLEVLAAAPDGGDAYAETTYRLIQIGARFAGNERLRRMIAALSLQSLRYSKLGLASVERRQRSVSCGVQALKALERGDVEQTLSWQPPAQRGVGPRGSAPGGWSRSLATA